MRIVNSEDEKIWVSDAAGSCWSEVVPDALRAAVVAGDSSSLRDLMVPGSDDFDPSDAKSLAPPVRPGKVVAIGLNYLDHVRETGMEAPTSPLVFAKFPSSVIGHGQEIVIDPAVTARADWEAELAVVIGREASHVPVERALEHVFGYTIANDISARDVQFSDVQWVRGKSLDTFCPLGPVLVTADEIADPQDLSIATYVNDEKVQDSNTAEMVFGVAELISFCSKSFRLEPGDVLLTGTPWGCGEFMEPKRSLAAGDVVRCEIVPLGCLTNPVIERVADSAG
jgi:5-carboxymethyl-2-hydroxymuconate isomerase